MTEKTTDPLSRPSIGVSILSWRSWSTLEKTLTSYRDASLFDFMEECRQINHKLFVYYVWPKVFG